MKAATLFSGFDGAGEGMKASGFEIAWGIELDDKIAQVARKNSHNVITADVLQVDPSDFEPVDALHISTPCTRASLANSTAEENEDGLKEAPLDMDLARQSIRFIEVLQPRIVTLENVWGYRKFQSFKGGKKCEGILPALERLGYWIDVQHVNAADFGVPQTRKRLILRAVKNGWVPHLPEPEPWRGWYEAIEDLLPTLPESEFAPWQLERLPAELKTFLVDSAGYPGNDGIPVPVIRRMEDPANTIVANFEKRPMRAFLVNGALSGQGEKTLQVHEAGEPSGTIVSSINNVKDTRALLSRGKVVKMTARCLARFQTFSDRYQLSGNNSLDCKGIGNACPPLLFEKLYRQLKEVL